jgi:hypothetical protein
MNQAQQAKKRITIKKQNRQIAISETEEMISIEQKERRSKVR